jgi:Fe(3+) dicitrate transport protein
MRSHIRSQQPGGLTDKQFEQDADQSFRARNWFDITWTTPAIILNYQIDAQTRWNTKLFATIGDRNSVGFLQPISVMDSINASTLQYNPRTVNIDQYRNLGLESRLLTAFKLGSQVQNFSAGIRLYSGRTDRRTEGKGTTGSEYDVTVSGNYPKDIRFTSSNAAIFAEQLFRIGKQLLIVPGIRYEWLSGSASGRNGYSSTGEEILLQNVTRSRGFVLGGIGFEYHVGKQSEFYANITQAYRPIQFANLQAPPGTDVIDPDLKDARGYNADIGLRGNLGGKLRYDMSVFYLKYDNRIGTITPDSANYRLVTNVGSNINKGFEGFIEWNASSMISKNKHTIFLLFATYGYTDARYSSDHKIASTKGKQVENAPKHILRGGISGGYQQVLLTLQVSYTGKTFSDANNTVVPSANAQAGEIPEYLITDLTGSFPVNKHVMIKAGINNLFDKKYFTRRAGGYPGPGLLPGDSRNFFITLGLKF